MEELDSLKQLLTGSYTIATYLCACHQALLIRKKAPRDLAPGSPWDRVRAPYMSHIALPAHQEGKTVTEGLLQVL
jgi:hypothetical protein